MKKHECYKFVTKKPKISCSGGKGGASHLKTRYMPPFNLQKKHASICSSPPQKLGVG